MSGWTECPACRGIGIVYGTGRCGCCDAPTEWDCTLCRGTGEVRADAAMDYLEREVSS